MVAMPAAMCCLFAEKIEALNFRGRRALVSERAGIQFSDPPLTREGKRAFSERKDALEWRDAELLAS
jgi:hypothetical protein